VPCGCIKILLCRPVYADFISRTRGAGHDSPVRVCRWTRFRPGNQFAGQRQKMLQNSVKDERGIDMPAGPSGGPSAADSGAPLPHVAADLLSQAEHGPDSPSRACRAAVGASRPSIRLYQTQVKLPPSGQPQVKPPHLAISTWTLADCSPIRWGAHRWGTVFSIRVQSAAQRQQAVKAQGHDEQCGRET
jgi:hypothetical protein